MKTVTTLLCTAISLLLSFEIFGQLVTQNLTVIEHLKSHVGLGTTPQQLDSLYMLVESRNKRKKEELTALILASKKRNKENILLKSECSVQNWGFELGNTSNWETLGCVSIENGGTDIYSNQSKINSGNFSLKLSNDMNANCLNSAIARTYSVPNSGKTFITIHFAVNIFNFPHIADHAAKFNFNLYDEELNLLDCPNYQAYYSTEEGPVGVPSLQETPMPATFYNPFVAGDMWFNSNVSYSNWHHVTIDLTQYAGTDVTMVFQNNWCLFDVDWIYTYIDVDCPINTSEPIPVCATSEVQLCAPEGMEASYDWEYNGLSLNNNESCLTTSNLGIYTLHFLPTYLECISTPYEINYEVAETPIADFSVAEFCIGSPLNIENTSEYASEYEWHYHGEVLNSEIPSIDYYLGEDEITLIAITGNCRDTLIAPLMAHVQPKPKFYFQNECIGMEYKIINQSTDPQGGPLDILWEISTDYSSNVWNPSYIPSNDLEFVISLKVTNQFGCSAEVASIAKAYSLPKAHFIQSENSLSENEAIVYFKDESSNDVTSWQWLIGDDFEYHGLDFYHEFTSAGTFSVVLVVQNKYNCFDTAFNLVQIVPNLNVYVPNTFTPNGDEYNNLFYPVFTGSDFDRKSYIFIIYDRWGEIVFQTNDAREGWNGFFNGNICSQGTYSWEIQFKGLNSEKLEHLVGHVNLIK